MDKLPMYVLSMFKSPTRQLAKKIRFVESYEGCWDSGVAATNENADLVPDVLGKIRNQLRDASCGPNAHIFLLEACAKAGIRFQDRQTRYEEMLDEV